VRNISWHNVDSLWRNVKKYGYKQPI
jgi:hypothetical protein